MSEISVWSFYIGKGFSLILGLILFVESLLVNELSKVSL